MDNYGDSQPTQATQTVVDPRRLGQQNSGFSDEDVSDIICILLPYSESAREELKRIATENSQHMVARENADRLDLDYELEDDPENFNLLQQDVGEHHVALRFSAQVKNPLQGFTFGRNAQRCDICLQNDPHRRLSNVHFRIYLNEHAVLMLEDQSTNGTIVDSVLLKSKANPPFPTRRTLSSGSKISILMHVGMSDLVFLVRIPLRQGRYQMAYERNLEAYMQRCERLVEDVNETIVPGPGGHVDIFKSPVQTRGKAVARRPQIMARETTQQLTRSDGLPKAWNGSDKYNRVGEIGKGAFATVYKVTSKFDGLPYAAKELDKRKFMKNGVLDQKVENEMKIMQKIQHANIVQYVEHLDWDDRLLIIIMEFIAGGDLGKMIAEVGPIPEFETRSIAKQLLGALGYLHDMNITHRDVKPDNILVSSRQPLTVKLTDFGLSKMIDNEETFLRTFCGTLLYCAPEVYTEFTEYDEHGRRHLRNRHRQPPGQRYDHAVDVWSLGGVLFYALTKRPPFPARNGASHSELLHSIMTRPLDIKPLLHHGVSDMGIDFLTKMLDRRPENRASVEELLTHPWVNGPGLSQSFDEIEDEELQFEASQLSLNEFDREKTVELANLDVIPESDDEILDDDANDENQFDGYGSEKENYTFGPGANGRDQQPAQGQRLFGEVNASAVGSSGGIANTRLNLPVSVSSSASTELQGAQVSEIPDSFDSSDASLTPRERSQRSQQKSTDLRASVLLASQNRSTDDLNNRTFDVASQSLGGAESILEHLNMKSRAGSLFRVENSDFNTSKRKPSVDSSDESEVAPGHDRRILKRLRSEGSAIRAGSPTVSEADYELLAQIPQISRDQSGRQIDIPVMKSCFWSAQDKSTWHLRYPEMTQLQFDAFKTGATSRGEEFGPGKTPLWNLAVKYFPPIHYEKTGSSGRPSRQGSEDSGVLPPTLANDLEGLEDMPNTQDQNPGARPQIDPADKRAVAVLQSAPGSAVTDMSVLVTEAMASWGRALENTRSYAVKSEAKVPKYAFKILLWKPDYDPAKNLRPWNRGPDRAEHQYHFYISTKASNGIHVNGQYLPSVNCRTPTSPCTYWIRLHDGDSVVVWQLRGQAHDGGEKAELTFRCNWGGSAIPRPHGTTTAFADEATAARLDELCTRVEKKVRSQLEQDVKLEEAYHDFNGRMRTIDLEREQSRAFEAKRHEAVRVMAARRGSPVPMLGAGHESLATQATWLSHVPGRTVPTFRTASPSAVDLLRGIRR
ncbi:hypothetical protein QBC39DRAFT_269694 [Podospora conica]|nr:hypothetical protein QBC39DRAFT_269694 [Schizothecium conicum]